MDIQFTCPCGARISLPEQFLYSGRSLTCPSCGEKISKKFIGQLQDFCVEKNSQYMDVGFISSEPINITYVMLNALQHGASIVNHKRISEGLEPLVYKGKDELIELLQLERSIDVSRALIQGAIVSYHEQLAKRLRAIGIEIGELID